MKLQLNKLLFFSILAIVLSVFVASIGTNDVSTTTPASGGWTKTLNYSAGYVFEWTNVGDTATKQALCTLYIKNETDTGLVAKSNEYYQASVANDTATTFYQNHSLPEGFITYYWTVKCYNESASPTSWYPVSKILYHDNSTPTISAITTYFTNNTFQKTSIVQINVTPLDHNYSWAQYTTCGIINVSNNQLLSSEYSILNNTKTTISFTAINVNYTNIKVRCTDGAGNEVNSSGYRVNVDTTSPTGSYAGATPADNYVNISTSIKFNITVTELNFASVTLKIDGTSYSLVEPTNCTGTAPNIRCTLAKTITQKRNIPFNFTITDDAGNTYNSVTRTFSVDTAVPTVPSVRNLTISDSEALFNISVTDVNPDTCVAHIYNRLGALQSTVSGTYGTIGASSSRCTGTITGADISLSGPFHVIYNISDTYGRYNKSVNVSGVMSQLYAGWNMITWSDVETNLGKICNATQYCTQVSLFSNTAKTFTTYSSSTPTVNPTTSISSGVAILIYVSSGDYLIMNEHLPSTGANVNTSLILGWNTVGLLDNTNMTKLMNYTILNNRNITYAGWLNGSNSNYYTCRRSWNLCTFGAIPNTIPLYKGYGVTILVEGNTTLVRNTTYIPN